MISGSPNTYKRTALKLRHGGRKRLSLIQMVMLTHFKAGFEKRNVASTAPKHLGLRQSAPSSFSFQGMPIESSLLLLVA